MVCNHDITELWNLKDPSKAVQVVKHEYKTKKTVKYLGNKNRTIPEKTNLVLFYGIVSILQTRSLPLNLFKINQAPSCIVFRG